MKFPQVRDFMDTEVPTIDPDMDLLDAVEFLLEHHVTGAPVVIEGDKLVGMFTEKDCLKLLAMGSENVRAEGRVKDFMTPNPTHVPSHMNVYFAAGVFMNANYRRLPVVDDGHLVGAITRFDILRAIKKN